MKEISATQPVSMCGAVSARSEQSTGQVGFQDKTQEYISQLSREHTTVEIHLGNYSPQEIAGLMQQYCWGNHIFIHTKWLESMAKNMDSFRKGKALLEEAIGELLQPAEQGIVARGILFLVQKRYQWNVQMPKQAEAPPIKTAMQPETQEEPVHISLEGKLHLSQGKPTDFFVGERLARATCSPKLRNSLVDTCMKLNKEKLQFMLWGQQAEPQLKPLITHLQKKVILYRYFIRKENRNYYCQWEAKHQQSQQHQQQLQQNRLLHQQQTRGALSGKAAYLRQTAMEAYLQQHKTVQLPIQPVQTTSPTKKDSSQQKAGESTNSNSTVVQLSSGLQAEVSSSTIGL